MMYPKPEEMFRRWRRREGTLNRCTEEQMKSRPARTERRSGREGEIDLEYAGQQEDAVDGRTNGEVKEYFRIEFRQESLRPLRKDSLHRHPVRDTKGEIEIGPAVATRCGSPNGSSSDQAGVQPRLLKERFPDMLTIFDTEHGRHLPISSRSGG
jgi:hypothetical protein